MKLFILHQQWHSLINTLLYHYHNIIKHGIRYALHKKQHKLF